MYRTHLSALALAAAALISAPAFAGGVAEPVVMAPVAAPAPVAGTDWTGFYGGLQLDFLTNGEDDGGATDGEFDGILYGVFGGYRYDFGNVVAGVELDYLHGSGDFETTTGINAGDVDDIDYQLTRVGVELGYDAGPALLYATGGYSYLEIDVPLGEFEDDGFFYGVGVDYLVTDRITVGAELLHHQWNDFEVDDNDFSATTFGVNVGFQF